MSIVRRPDIGATVLGYPRIGAHRELKSAIEGYWAGRLDAAALTTVADAIKTSTWADLASLDSIPGNTFSFYDQMLDTAVGFDAIPPRFRDLQLSELDTYFAMARGHGDVTPLELTKWFDTNYHYLVPELSPETVFRLATNKPLAEFRQAQAAGIMTRPVLIGPVTFLLLAKAAAGAPDGFVPLALLDQLVESYAELLAALAAAGADWVQLDEPAFVADRSHEELAALHRAYTRLGSLTQRPGLLVATYFGDPGPALPIIASTTVDAIAVDLVSAPGLAERLHETPGLLDKTLVAGVVDGRNVWRTATGTALAQLTELRSAVGRLAVSTSCSLLHVPYDLAVETDVDKRLLPRLAFARQKVAEVAQLAQALAAGQAAPQIATTPTRAPVNAEIRSRVTALTSADLERLSYAERAAAQQAVLNLPELATTTIGSFPQTPEIRAARAALRAGELAPDEYAARMRAEIGRVVGLQEEIGLDVLVHGEPERNDMVQYFAELLDGFAATANGWVQSYGTRCVRPPIVHGDVSRPAPMTVEWSSYAQSLTSTPMKAMLTGPVTIVAWSFVRNDQPLADTAQQIALALRDEIADLEAAGIRVVQVDEPALRELLPLRDEDRKAYLDWAVAAFRLATAGSASSTQIQPHLCYSEFGEVIDAINGLDADVTTIEAARSRMEVLDDLAAIGFERGVGPGVYDIHSPRVPTEDELAELLSAARKVVPGERLWANPDCGLKTRRYDEVEPALRHLVTAARRVREENVHDSR